MYFRSLAILLTLTLLACGGSPEPAADQDMATDQAAAPNATPEESAGTASSETSTQKTSGQNPCTLLTAEDIGNALAADASTVGTGEPGPFPSEGTKDCVWEVVHAGLEETVSLWMRFHNDTTSPNAWSNAISGYLENGEKIGSQTIAHEPADLGGVTGGSLSGVHGGAFVKSRIYSWHVDEEIFYRLTISRSLGDGAEELLDPPAEAFEKLVTAIMQ